MTQNSEAGELILGLYRARRPETGYTLFEPTFGHSIDRQTRIFINRHPYEHRMRAHELDISLEIRIKAHKRLTQEPELPTHQQIQSLPPWMNVFIRRRLLDARRRYRTKKERSQVLTSDGLVQSEISAEDALDNVPIDGLKTYDFPMTEHLWRKSRLENVEARLAALEPMDRDILFTVLTLTKVSYADLGRLYGMTKPGIFKRVERLEAQLRAFAETPANGRLAPAN